MRSKLTTALSVIGAVTVLVLAANTVALAATGSALIAGKTTSAGKITVVKRTKPGAALGLVTKSRYNAPLVTNGQGRVANLNADKVDGLEGSRLWNRSYEFHAAQFTNADSVRYRLDLPAGAYAISYSTFLNGTEPGGVECYVAQDNPPGTDDVFGAWSSLIVPTNANDWDPSLSASGVFTKTAKNRLYVNCDSDDNVTFSNDSSDTPFQIVATPTEVVGGAAKALPLDNSAMRQGARQH